VVQLDQLILVVQQVQDFLVDLEFLELLDFLVFPDFLLDRLVLMILDLHLVLVVQLVRMVLMVQLNPCHLVAQVDQADRTALEFLVILQLLLILYHLPIQYRPAVL
jgi:hypothetical protein